MKEKNILIVRGNMHNLKISSELLKTGCLVGKNTYSEIRTALPINSAYEGKSNLRFMKIMNDYKKRNNNDSQ